MIDSTPYFTGRAAAFAYQFVLNRVGQQPAMAGDFVPMEADGYLSHWKSPELTWDVMAPSGRDAVLSPVTIAAMQDLGYKVDMLQAEEPRIPRATKLTAVAPQPFCGGAQIHIITP